MRPSSLLLLAFCAQLTLVIAALETRSEDCNDAGTTWVTWLFLVAFPLGTLSATGAAYVFGKTHGWRAPATVVAGLATGVLWAVISLVLLALVLIPAHCLD
jgi:hypothetical protein